MATMDSERRGAVYQRRADTGVWWGERGITLLAFWGRRLKLAGVS